MKAIALAALLSSSVVLPGSRMWAAADPAPKPNIILIFADDLGWKDVGWNNEGGFIETPNLDRLKTQGMMFTAA